MICDINKAIKFIQFLNNKNKNIVAINDKQLYGITTSDIDKIKDFLSKYCNTHNLYYNANNANNNAPNDKLKKIDIDSINAIWIDLDPAKDLDLQQERNRLFDLAKQLNDSDLPPSYIIDSGNGIQCLWLLNKSLPYDSYKEVEALMKGLNLKYNGDNTHNIDRLLRIPFTINFPNEIKKKQNRTNQLSKVIYATQNKYDWEQLQTLATPIEINNYEKVDYNLDFEFPPTNFPDELKEKWKNTLKEDYKLQILSKKQINFPSRSEYDFNVAGRLKQANWNINEVATLLYYFPHGKNKEITPREITRAFQRSFDASKTMKLNEEYIKHIESQKNPLDVITEKSKPIRKYKAAGELSWKNTSTPLFKNFIKQGTLVSIYGQSNVGKSFIATDIAAHVALGKDWAGFKCKNQGSVLYVAAEAASTYGERADAVKLRMGLPLNVNIKDFPFAVYDEPISLFKTNKKNGLCEGLEDLIAQTKFLYEDTNKKCKLIVIDTLAAVFGGGNENSFDDMGLLVERLLILANKTGATILIVHHSGKDQTKGERGHSSLFAALDTSLEIKLCPFDGKEKREIVTRKQRSTMKGDNINFHLNIVELGKDDDGDNVTSCNILLPCDSEFESVIDSEMDMLTLDQSLIYLSIFFSSINNSKIIIAGKPAQNRFSMFYYDYLLNKKFKNKDNLMQWMNKMMCENNDNILKTCAQIGLCASPFSLDKNRAKWIHFKRHAHKISTNLGIEKDDKKQYVIESSTLQHKISTNKLC